MNDALTISGLTKNYKDFVLDGISFSVPSGSIVGLIGENGAGKSTTINATLGLIQKEAGSVSVLGKEELDNEIKEQVGVVFDGSNYPEILSPRKLNRVLKNIYQSWDERTFLIVLIHEGKVVFSKPKDELTEQYGIIKCGAAQFDALDKSDIIVYRKMDYEWQVLISDRTAMQKKYPKAMIVPATIDEIMLLYVKGEK